MSEPFLGQVYLVGYNFAMRGFALCEGQILPISSNTALFSLLGTYYGGNGTSTFGLPDLRGRVPIGQGAGPGLSAYSIGQTGGSQTTSLSTANMPNHTHVATLMAENGGAAANTPGGNLLAQADVYLAPGRAPNAAMASSAIQVSSEGGSQPFDKMPPFLVMNYQIALQGLYPSRE